MRGGLDKCEENSWPLALSRNTKVAADDEQSYYTYPLMRLP